LGKSPEEIMGSIPLGITDKLTLNLDRIAEEIPAIRDQMSAWDALIKD
jgi:hypothetical protein